MIFDIGTILKNKDIHGTADKVNINQGVHKDAPNNKQQHTKKIANRSRGNQNAHESNKEIQRP